MHYCTWLHIRGTQARSQEVIVPPYGALVQFEAPDAKKDFEKLETVRNWSHQPDSEGLETKSYEEQFKELNRSPCLVKRY